MDEVKEAVYCDENELVSRDVFNHCVRIVKYHLRHDVYPRFERDALYAKWKKEYEKLLEREQEEVKAASDSLVDGVATSAANAKHARVLGLDVDGHEDVASGAKRVHMHGWLWKRGNRIKTWKHRHFVLKTGTLSYYNQQSDLEPIKEVKVDGATAVIVADSKYKRPNCLEVVTPHSDRVWVLQAASPQEANKWIKAFKKQLLTMRRTRAVRKSTLAERGMISVEVVDRFIEGSGSRAHCMYSIRVRSGDLTWTVAKRYSEFASLHKKLKASFPRPYSKGEISAFPEKSFGSSCDPFVVESRMVGFNRYLHSILSISEINHSLHVLEFLGLLNINQQVLEKNDTRVPVAKEVNVVRIPEVVDIGDVILVRSKSTLAKVTRGLTRSPWDHVAMVVRSPMFSMRMVSCGGGGVVVKVRGVEVGDDMWLGARERERVRERERGKREWKRERDCVLRIVCVISPILTSFFLLSFLPSFLPLFTSTPSVYSKRSATQVCRASPSKAACWSGSTRGQL